MSIKRGKNVIETVEELEAWLNEGEYCSEEKFTWKPSDVRPVETQEEFDAIVEQCIREKLFDLSPEEIRTFLTQPVTFSGFEEGKSFDEVIDVIRQEKVKKILKEIDTSPL